MRKTTLLHLGLLVVVLVVVLLSSVSVKANEITSFNNSLSIENITYENQLYNTTWQEDGLGYSGNYYNFTSDSYWLYNEGSPGDIIFDRILGQYVIIKRSFISGISTAIGWTQLLDEPKCPTNSSNYVSSNVNWVINKYQCIHLNHSNLGKDKVLLNISEVYPSGIFNWSQVINHFESIRYLAINKKANVTSAIMNLTGIDNLTNPYLEIGTQDGTYEWNYTGNFNVTNQTSDFSAILNNVLNDSNCNCDGCILDINICNIPFTFNSLNDSVGIIKYSDFNVTYTILNNPPDIDAISLNESIAYYGININISSINSTDPEADNYTLRCGDVSGSYNLCNSSEMINGTDSSCVFTFTNTSVSGNYVIYCRLQDTGGLYSSEVNSTLIIDNSIYNSISSPSNNSIINSNNPSCPETINFDFSVIAQSTNTCWISLRHSYYGYLNLTSGSLNGITPPPEQTDEITLIINCTNTTITFDSCACNDNYFDLKLYANNSAGVENSTTNRFYLCYQSQEGTSHGGGGGGLIEVEVEVPALEWEFREIFDKFYFKTPFEEEGIHTIPFFSNIDIHKCEIIQNDTSVECEIDPKDVKTLLIKIPVTTSNLPYVTEEYKIRVTSFKETKEILGTISTINTATYAPISPMEIADDSVFAMFPFKPFIFEYRQNSPLSIVGVKLFIPLLLIIFLIYKFLLVK